MNRASFAFLFRPTFHRTLCGIVAGVAVLGSTVIAQADQNGKRERGAGAVAQHRQDSGQRARSDRGGNRNDDRGQGRARGNDRNDDRGRSRGHDRHGDDDDRGHRGGHGHADKHGGGHHHGHGHKGSTIEIHIGGTWHGRPRYVESCPPKPFKTWAQIEYERGFADAQVAGFQVGKSDALCWNPFCDSPTVCFDRVSSHYRDGYLAAYACAYKDGYAAGECERQTVRLRYGSHSVKYRTSCRW